MAGNYTDIISIDAPGSAAAGIRVNVIIKIQNTYSTAFDIYCVGILNTYYGFMDWLKATVPAGYVATYSGSFIMPGYDSVINISSYYMNGGKFYSDDEMARAISLATQQVPGSEFRSLAVAVG